MVLLSPMSPMEAADQSPRAQLVPLSPVAETDRSAVAGPTVSRSATYQRETETPVEKQEAVQSPEKR
jgi:hypothetical protein